MANDRISDLAPLSSFTGMELLEVSQPTGGSPAYVSKRATAALLKSYITAGTAAATQLFMMGLDGDPGDDGAMGPQGATGPAGSGGGGGSTAFNLTPDTHTSTPTFVANDEFEGTVLDTAGTRFTGALPWVWFNQQSSTASLADGTIQLSAPASNPNTNYSSAILQTMASAPCVYQSKWATWIPGNQCRGGITLMELATSKFMNFGIVNNGGSLNMEINTYTSGQVYQTGFSGVFPNSNNEPSTPLYLQMTITSTTVQFAYSRSGLPGTFLNAGSAYALTSYFTTGPDHVGLHVYDQVDNASGLNTVTYADWFRRIS